MSPDSVTIATQKSEWERVLYFFSNMHNFPSKSSVYDTDLYKKKLNYQTLTNYPNYPTSTETKDP